MGGGTWVYLGTFAFDKGCNIYNRVVLTNHSKRRGFVTADAVRFGGGMGNIVRGGQVSGLPRTLEGARYYTQWAGAPRYVVSRSNGNKRLQRRYKHTFALYQLACRRFSLHS